MKIMNARYVMLAAAALAVCGSAQAQKALSVSVETTVIQETRVPRKAKALDPLSAEEARKDPYGFIQKTITRCDVVKATIETQQVEVKRLENQSNRKIAEAISADKRYAKFLVDAKAAYDAAKGPDGQVKWPVDVNGFPLDEDVLSEKILDAQERVERAKAQKAKNEMYLKRIKVRQDLYRASLRDLAKYRATLTEKAEDVKMNQILGEVADIAEVIGGLKDMEITVSSKFSLDEMTHEDPEDKRREKARKFLDN